MSYKCLVNDYWDIFLMFVFLFIFMAGVFWMIETVYKLTRPKSNVEQALVAFKSLERDAESERNYEMLSKLKFIKDNLL